MKKTLPLILFIILTGFLSKVEPDNIESLLIDKKLKFLKSDSLDIVKIFGHDFEFKKSWRHARLRGGECWNWSYYFLDYSKIGVQFKLMKQVNYDKKPKLFLIHLYHPYKYAVLGNIKIGETNFKELREKYAVDKLVYSQDRSDSLVLIEQKFKNYTFKTNLKMLLNDNLEKEIAINYLDSITSNEKIKSVDIYEEE